MKSNWMTQGFEMIEIVVNVENCLEVLPYFFLYIYLHVVQYTDHVSMNMQAYVGFASDINAVVVVFRGTQENR